MGHVMTGITCVVAIGTAVTAVARRTAMRIVPIVNAWILMRNIALENVESPHGPATGFAMTTTTTAPATGMLAIVVARQASNCSTVTAQVVIALTQHKVREGACFHLSICWWWWRLLTVRASSMSDRLCSGQALAQ